jgi:hypothetical protein
MSQFFFQCNVCRSNFEQLHFDDKREMQRQSEKGECAEGQTVLGEWNGDGAVGSYRDAGRVADQCQAVDACILPSQDFNKRNVHV